MSALQRQKERQSQLILSALQKCQQKEKSFENLQTWNVVTGQGRKLKKIRLSLKNPNVELEKRYYAWKTR